MQKLRIGFGIALALTLAIGLAALAPAATKKLEGKIKGDSDSKVTAKVVIKDRDPVRVNDFKIRKLDFDCGGGGTLQGTVEGPEQMIVLANDSFESKGNGITVKGKVKRQGRKIGGTVEAELKFEGKRCEAKDEFKAG